MAVACDFHDEGAFVPARFRFTTKISNKRVDACQAHVERGLLKAGLTFHDPGSTEILSVHKFRRDGIEDAE